MLTTGEVYDETALALLTAAATALGADLKAGLYTNNPAVAKNHAVADFTEPTYASYLRQAVVMGVPFRDPVNGISALSAGLTWQETGAVTPVIINGIFYVSGAGPYFMGMDPFKNPIALNDLFDAFTTVLQYIQNNQFAGFTTVLQ